MAYHPLGGSAVYCAKKLVDMSIYLTRSDWKRLPNCLIKMCHYSSPGWLSKEKGTGNFLFAFWRYGVVECNFVRRILSRAIILHSLMMEWPPILGLWFIDWRQLKSLLHLVSVIKNYPTCFCGKQAPTNKSLATGSISNERNETIQCSYFGFDKHSRNTYKASVGTDKYSLHWVLWLGG